MKSKRKIIKIVSIILICIIVAGSGYMYLKGKDTVSAEATSKFNESQVIIGDIKESVTGSSIIESNKRQQVKYDKAGTVEKVFVEEGQKVEKGDIILTLESDSETTSLEIAQKNLELERNSYSDLVNDLDGLKVYALADGIIDIGDIKVGNQLQSNSIFGTIVDKTKMEIAAPYNLNVVKKIKVGQDASILFADNFSTVKGTVIKVSESSLPSNTGGIYYEVTIEFDNPGGLSAGMIGQATVTTSNGTYQAVENVEIEDKEGTNVNVETNGKVLSLNVSTGDYVKKGDLLAVLESESLLTQIENQKIRLEQKELEINDKIEDLEDVAITAPITGTIVKLDAADGDNVDMGNNVCVIADTEDLIVVLPIDELDVFKIEEGQEAVITTDIFPKVIYSGNVKRIAMEGTSQNEVSTFDVTVALNEIDNLRLGMTVDVEVVIAKAEDTLLLPVEAIQKIGNRNVVMITNEVSAEGEQVNIKDNYKMIEIGLSSEDYVEIISGLKEGQTVYYASAISKNIDYEKVPVKGMGIPGMGGGKAPAGKGKNYK